MIETFTKEEQAIFIVALFLLLFAIVMSYAMIQDYRILLIQNKKYEKEFCKIEMAFHDALVRDNHDYAIHDVGEKYYSN